MVVSIRIYYRNEFGGVELSRLTEEKGKTRRSPCTQHWAKVAPFGRNITAIPFGA